jgi:hypothetical protein
MTVVKVRVRTGEGVVDALYVLDHCHILRRSPLLIVSWRRCIHWAFRIDSHDCCLAELVWVLQKGREVQGGHTVPARGAPIDIHDSDSMLEPANVESSRVWGLTPCLERLDLPNSLIPGNNKTAEMPAIASE